jgi:hypothetical protein
MPSTTNAPTTAILVPIKTQDDIDLQDCQCVPKEIEDQACPECGRRFIVKSEEVVFG